MMGRPAVFPLPDDQAKRIIAAVEELAQALPAAQGTRQFLAAFIARVHAITGRVYGHTTYRRMLALYAPEYRPATDTIQAEIRAFRSDMDASGGAESTRKKTGTPAAEPVAQARRPPRQQEHDEGRALQELARLQALDIDRLRQDLASAMAHANRLEDARSQLAADLAGERARVESLERVIEQLRADHADMLTRIERIQDQADSARKDAMVLIDALRGETRAAQAETKAVQAALDVALRELRQEEELSSLLRTQLSAVARPGRTA